MNPAFQMDGKTRTAFACCPSNFAVGFFAYSCLSAAVTSRSMAALLAADAGQEDMPTTATTDATAVNVSPRRIVISCAGGGRIVQDDAPAARAGDDDASWAILFADLELDAT